MLATVVIVFAATYGLEHSGLLEGRSRGRRALIQAGVIFVLIFALNLIWPYGS